MGSTEPMSLLNSLYVAVFGMSVVFIVLIGLSFLVRLQTAFVSKFITHKGTHMVSAPEQSAPEKIGAPKAEQQPRIRRDELRLVNVDDQTAAVIMAIVSHEMKARPQELDFKSIAALDMANRLKLIDVDDQTAAITMAIVSNEMKSRPDELNFKTIKALDTAKKA